MVGLAVSKLSKMLIILTAYYTSLKELPYSSNYISHASHLEEVITFSNQVNYLEATQFMIVIFHFNAMTEKNSSAVFSTLPPPFFALSLSLSG